MTTVEARVVDPVQSHASVNAVNVSETQLVDAALKHEQKKMLEDEEIDSCEGEDLEEQMINVALMNSVAESVSTQPPPLEIVTRYGLRKRPRPGNPCDGENTIEIDMKNPPSIVTSGIPRATITNGRLSFVTPLGDAVGDSGGRHSIPRGDAAVPRLKREPLPVVVPSLQTISSTPTAGVPTQGRQRSVQQPIAPNVKVEDDHGEGLPTPQVPPLLNSVSPQKKAPSPSKTRSKPIGSKAKKASLIKAKVGRQVSKTKCSQIAVSELRTAPLELTSGAVPNPLSQSTPPAPARSVKTAMKSAPKVLNQPFGQASGVPCPLPDSVPCPLQSQPSESQVEKRVTIADPPVPITRGRIFSVDLDRKFSSLSMNRSLTFSPVSFSHSFSCPSSQLLLSTSQTCQEITVMMERATMSFQTSQRI